MSQCVPSWDLDATTTTRPHSNDVPSMDYEVAELTWENGQLAMHGLATHKPTRPGPGTLESLVNQATTCHVPPVNDLPPWLDHRRAASVALDALVPCTTTNHHHHQRMCACKTNVSVTESTPLWSPENTSSGKDYTKTTSGEDHDYSVSHSRSQREEEEEEEEEEEVGKKKVKSGSGKSSVVSNKRSRAAAIHNQSERKRRDKINQRMKTLQKLVPNSSKTDKASILDEVIEYVKQLQAQVHSMNRMNIPQMMLPLQALQHQQLHMSMMAAAAAAAQQPHHMSMMAAAAAAAATAQQPHHLHMPVMDFNSLNRAAAAMSPPIMAPRPPFMPLTGPWDVPGDHPIMPHDILSAFLVGQSTQPQQPMTMDTYSRLAALYQQFQQGLGSSSKN